ncbi:unnamed protein product [Vitrella brassicaformis CCMP3155]|uniref:Uncharacterized protein n=1 Tax=Vitrella brassicaformis (strain CCMP3155) TaxID=1169540 RepID=A0A0G4EPX6_VITBC|nr:unnamed protein product [Vitrella brassicaformis CCMP3155]|eukprot:CEL99648.1 unnamed protein product [Vitrella brassicaformis CCMP3155]
MGAINVGLKEYQIMKRMRIFTKEQVDAFHDISRKDWPVSTYVPEQSFVESEMHPVMARIELEEDKLTEEDRKSDPVLAPFYDDVDRQLTREDFLQSLVDLKHVYEAYDSVIDNYEMLAPLQATGPMTRWAYLEEDIDALTELMGVDAPEPSEVGAGYGDEIKSIAARSQPGVLGHLYNFYKEWDMGGRTVIKSTAARLNIPRNFKLARRDGDSWNIAATLDVIADKWTPEQKEECLTELSRANQLASQLVTLLHGTEMEEEEDEEGEEEGGEDK